MKPLAILVLAAIGTSGCAAITSPDGEQERLDFHRDLFDAKVGASYKIDYGRNCFCPETVTGTVVITVKNDVIIAVTKKSDSSAIPADKWAEYGYLTVDQLFSTIEAALDDDVDELRVTYDETQGFPREVYIDPSQGVADDEGGYALASAVVLK